MQNPGQRMYATFKYDFRLLLPGSAVRGKSNDEICQWIDVKEWRFRVCHLSCIDRTASYCLAMIVIAL